MLRFNGFLCGFIFAGLIALGCDSSSSPATGTGGTIGGGTGGNQGTGGSDTGTGGAGGMPAGGTGGATGGSGGLSPTQQNEAIINAVVPVGVVATDPSIAGTPPVYMTGGVCQ